MALPLPKMVFNRLTSAAFSTRSFAAAGRGYALDPRILQDFEYGLAFFKGELVFYRSFVYSDSHMNSCKPQKTALSAYDNNIL